MLQLAFSVLFGNAKPRRLNWKALILKRRRNRQLQVCVHRTSGFSIVSMDMYYCPPLETPEVEYDCDVFLYTCSLSHSSGSDFELPPSSSPPILSPLLKMLPSVSFDFLKHWQAVFVFKSGAAHETADGAVIMLEAGKTNGSLEGRGFVASREVLDLGRPRKVYLRSGRFSLKSLTNALASLNESQAAYCFVWNNCQEWIARLMRQLKVPMKHTRSRSVVNGALVLVSLCLFAYLVYFVSALSVSLRWPHTDAAA